MELSELRKYMKLALEMAAGCSRDVPVAAIIVKNQEILASAVNQREELNDPLAHAEMIAIREAARVLGSWRLSGCTLICTLEPCPMCAEAIIQSRMERLVFGAYDQVYGACGSAFNLFCKRQAVCTPELITGILEKECSLQIRDFFKQRRKHAD